MTFVWIGLGVVLLLWVVVTYNRFRSLDVKSEEALSGIDTVLVQRYDTLINLINSVKGYIKHEKETLQKITELRAQVSQNQLSKQEMLKKDGELQASLPNFSVIAENYPDLKASENVQTLMKSVNHLESTVAASRRTYNAVVNQYNQKCVTIPSSIVAGMCGFKKKDFFAAEENKKENVEVKF